ncbi:putative enoyl-CoA hydratase echA8 [compost metagenome]
MDTQTYQDLLVEQRGAVVRITINRPDKMNSLRMTHTDRELVAALAHAESRRDVKVVLLTGAGTKAFCTGWDMQGISECSLADLEALVRSNLELFFKIWHLRMPVVAAINGYALGAGSAIALACDLALAADNAKLGEPEVRHGALSPFFAMPFMTHSRVVHELSYFGDTIDAQELLRVGLVNRVVPAEGFEEEAWRYAQRLSNVPAFSLEMTKRSLRAAYDTMGFSAVVRQHGLADTLVIGANFPEQKQLQEILVQQGMRAFLEARDGPFRENP